MAKKAEEKPEVEVVEKKQESLPTTVTDKEGLMSKIKSKKKWLIGGAIAVGAVVLLKVGKLMGSNKSETDEDDLDSDDIYDDDFDLDDPATDSDES